MSQFFMDGKQRKSLDNEFISKQKYMVVEESFPLIVYVCCVVELSKKKAV